MGGFLIAALVGEGILMFRAYKQHQRLPLPAELLGVSGLFVILGIMAEWQPELATMLAVGLDLAALLNAWPTTGSVTGALQSTKPNETAPLPKQGPITI